MDLNTILEKAIETDASDIFIIAGLPVTFKINGGLRRIGETMMKPDDITACAVKPNGTVTKFKCSVGALTDPEHRIIADGCLINFYRNN